MSEANDFHEQAMKFSADLTTMADKRELHPVTIMMGVANTLASCLTTAAVMSSAAMTTTKQEAVSYAIAFIQEKWPEVAADILKQALYKLEHAGLADATREFRAKHPDADVPPMPWENDKEESDGRS